jgi:hypothetical protein
MHLPLQEFRASQLNVRKYAGLINIALYTCIVECVQEHCLFLKFTPWHVWREEKRMYTIKKNKFKVSFHHSSALFSHTSPSKLKLRRFAIIHK